MLSDVRCSLFVGCLLLWCVVSCSSFAGRCVLCVVRVCVMCGVSLLWLVVDCCLLCVGCCLLCVCWCVTCCLLFVLRGLFAVSCVACVVVDC